MGILYAVNNSPFRAFPRLVGYLHQLWGKYDQPISVISGLTLLS